MMGKINWKKMWNECKGKKEQWLILLLVGILILVIAMPISDKDSTNKEEDNSLSVTENDVEEITDSSYARRLERRLEEALAQMQGVGQVSVMITLSSSAEKVVEKDNETSSEISEETDSGNKSTSSSSSETSIYEGSSGEEVPYVKKELSPEIEGVLVIADGGDDAVVIENITESVQALFGVDTHKIKVMKRN